TWRYRGAGCRNVGADAHLGVRRRAGARDGPGQPLVIGVDGPTSAGKVTGLAGRAGRESGYIDGDDARDGLDEGGNYISRDSLAKAAIGETVVSAKRSKDGSLNGLGVVRRVISDVGFEAE